MQGSNKLIGAIGHEFAYMLPSMHEAGDVCHTPSEPGHSLLVLSRRPSALPSPFNGDRFIFVWTRTGKLRRLKRRIRRGPANDNAPGEVAEVFYPVFGVARGLA